jgi:hypothetical protein
MRVLALAAASALAIAVVPDLSAAEARKKPSDAVSRAGKSPSVIAERQRHKDTFDETQYYERLSEQIPFGSAAWWRQKQLEQSNE